MNYKDLYNRIRETTGLDVLTENVIQTVIENTYADLTSRGYREFGNATYKTDSDDATTLLTDEGYGLYSIPLPSDYRKTLFLKVIINNKVVKAQRIALTDERLNTVVVDGDIVRSNFEYMDFDAMFYIVNNTIYIETKDRNTKVTSVILGYDKRLVAPSQPALKDYATTEINVRPDFEDALVLYGTYMLISRYSKDTDRVQLALNNYKYFVEDITYVNAYEDNYGDEDGIVCVERV